MTREEALALLTNLQTRFGALIRTPLDRRSGTLRAVTEAYDPSLCSEVSDARGAERLAVYQRQYWFRLFTTLQNEYPLTARLIGMWHFNALASDYLCREPPRHFDLQAIAHGFVAYLEAHLRPHTVYQRVPTSALLEAATLDQAFARVFLAPEVVPFRLADVAPSALASTRLPLSPTVVFVSESFALLELRKRILRDPSERPVALPPRLDIQQHWAIFRTDRGHGIAPLEAVAFQLFTLLSERPLGEALAELEARFPDQRDMPALVQALLAKSVKLGFWAEAVADRL